MSPQFLLQCKINILKMKIHLILISAAMACIFLKQPTPQLKTSSNHLQHQCTSCYSKIIHNFDPEAKCLDGSPAALYLHQGGDKNKILIYFEGGEFCAGQTRQGIIESCYQRSKTILGSSDLMPQQVQREGYLSSDPAISVFANWTKIIVGYCDGSLYQGLVKEPIKYKDTSLYFRGAAITRSHFNWINSKYNLKGAEKIILGGGSAGGSAAYLWTNHLKSMINDPKIVYSIDDSGILLNFNTINGHPLLYNIAQAFYKTVNVDESTPLTECNKLYKGREWECFFFKKGSKVVNGNFMMIASEYDYWAIQNVLGIKCLKNGTNNGRSLAECSSMEMNHIENYRSGLKNVMRSFTEANPNSSVWSIACSNHVYACLDPYYNTDSYRVPAVNGTTIKNVLEAFVLKDERNIETDEDTWPNNQACAY